MYTVRVIAYRCLPHYDNGHDTLSTTHIIMREPTVTYGNFPSCNIVQKQMSLLTNQRTPGPNISLPARRYSRHGRTETATRFLCLTFRLPRNGAGTFWIRLCSACTQPLRLWHEPCGGLNFGRCMPYSPWWVYTPSLLEVIWGHARFEIYAFQRATLKTWEWPGDKAR